MTTGRRGELFNIGKDTLQSARYCYFDLRDLDGEPELMAAIVYVIFSKVYRDIANEDLRAVQKRFVLDEAHRYITDSVVFILDLAACPDRPALEYHAGPDYPVAGRSGQPGSTLVKGHHYQSQAGVLFPRPKGRGNFIPQLQLTDHHIQQYKKLDASRYEVLYWSDGVWPGCCGLLQTNTPTGSQPQTPGNES